MGHLSSPVSHRTDVGVLPNSPEPCTRARASTRRELLWLLGLLGLSVLAESFGHIPIYGVPAASAPVVASFPVCVEPHCAAARPGRRRR